MAAQNEPTFYQIPAVLPVPYRPVPIPNLPELDDLDSVKDWAASVEGALRDISRWSIDMHSSIYDNHITSADRVENLTMIGEKLSERPSAIGSRRFFYHRPNRALYMDVRSGTENYWDIVFAQDSTIVILDTSNFDKILGPDDSQLQVAMDILDDHIHAASEITVETASFARILGSTDDDVQHALETLDNHAHLVFEVAASEPADESLNNGEAVFWFVASL
jgi:hypothetical protein